MVPLAEISTICTHGNYVDRLLWLFLVFQDPSSRITTGGRDFFIVGDVEVSHTFHPLVDMELESIGAYH